MEGLSQVLIVQENGISFRTFLIKNVLCIFKKRGRSSLCSLQLQILFPNMFSALCFSIVCVLFSFSEQCSHTETFTSTCIVWSGLQMCFTMNLVNMVKSRHTNIHTYRGTQDWYGLQNLLKESWIGWNEQVTLCKTTLRPIWSDWHIDSLGPVEGLGGEREKERPHKDHNMSCCVRYCHFCSVLHFTRWTNTSWNDLETAE